MTIKMLNINCSQQIYIFQLKCEGSCQAVLKQLQWWLDTWKNEWLSNRGGGDLILWKCVNRRGLKIVGFSCYNYVTSYKINMLKQD